MSIQTINPATGNVIQTYTEMTDIEINKTIAAVHNSYKVWRHLSFEKRAIAMRSIAKLLRERKKMYGLLITEEMGKPLAQAEAEVEKCALVCDYYANNAADYLKPREIATNSQKSYVTYQPMGIVFAIMPWNFPFWQVFRFAAPTLMAGNAALLKHAPISTGSALAIEKLFLDAGFPENLFRTLVISTDSASIVINHSHVAAVTLTGSPKAGGTVAAIAAKALKKSVLELGGSDPYLILEDADLMLAADKCVTSRMQNAGQSCIAAKRLIVIESVQEKFLHLIKEKIQTYVLGNPLDQIVTCGPLARKDLRDGVHAQVQKSIQLGATLILGGKIPQREGFYYEPTILTNVTKGMPAYDEEIFGPVITLITAKNEEEAITIANDSTYGLGAGIFTQDIARGEKIAAEKIQAGSCVINTFLASDPKLPFGGIKHSGYGRELSAEGARSFVNVKTIIVQ